MPVDKGRELGFQVMGRVIFWQEQIGKKGIVAPIGHEVVFSIDGRIFQRIEGKHYLRVEMGVGGQGLEDAGDFKVVLVVESDDFIDGVGIAKIFVSDLRGDDDRKGIAQGIVAIALQESEVKNVEQVIVSVTNIFFSKDLLFIAHGQVADGQDPGDLFDVREVVLEQWSKGGSDCSQVKGNNALLIVEAAGYAPDAVCFAVVFIVAGLMQDIGKDEQAAGESDGKPEEVDE